MIKTAELVLMMMIIIIIMMMKSCFRLGEDQWEGWEDLTKAEETRKKKQ